MRSFGALCENKQKKIKEKRRSLIILLCRPFIYIYQAMVVFLNILNFGKRFKSIFFSPFLGSFSYQIAVHHTESNDAAGEHDDSFSYFSIFKFLFKINK